ncbi:MAG TPA: tetratricopeptide repeat protein [Terriglobales bacterium]|nr:tetratricopeptide repeat protein [Terriglobales bacterium]
MPPKFFTAIPVILIGLTALGAQDAPKKAAPSPAARAERAAKLAESGQCPEALPLLQKSLSVALEDDLKRRVAFSGLHCAMVLNQQDKAIDFVQFLNREFPKDPEVLYQSAHAYSDLSIRASQELIHTAPTSYQVHELNAEALETQEKWPEAAAEYRKILEHDPRVPGIHYRLARVLLSMPPSSTTLEEIKKEFEQEVEIDPSNAGAEYALGNLAWQSQQWDDSIKHFTRASKLDGSFADAFFALGRVLISAERFSEAIPPLERFVQLVPGEPVGHFQLATAYSRTGHKAEATKEFALYRQTTDAVRDAKDKLGKDLSAAPTPQ